MIQSCKGPLGGILLAVALAGCQETAAVAERPRVDAPGIPLSVQSIAGAPDPITTQFASLLGEAAADRSMEIVAGDKPARYRVRGYLTAEPTEDGQTALAFVWDVYDAKRQRAQRVTGASLGSRSGGGDPWASIDRTVVAKAASDSMDAIAGFLVSAPADETPAASATTRTRTAEAGPKR